MGRFHKDTKKFLFEPLFSFTEEELSEILVALGADFTRPQGENVQANRCFLHGNNSPTLGVSIHSPHPWNCFIAECHRGSDIVSLVAIAQRCDRADAIAWLFNLFPNAETTTSDVSFTSQKEAQERPFSLSPAVLAAYPLDAHNRRGFKAIAHLDLCTEEQAVEYQLGYDKRQERLLFPVFHPDGKLAGLIGRSMLIDCPKSHRWYNYDEGHFKKAKCLMGAEQPLDPKHPITIVEGPGDYIFLRSCGVPNVRGLMGADFSEFQMELVMSYGHDVVPLFDADKPGYLAKDKFKRRAQGRCRILPVHYPEEYLRRGLNDPRALGREGVKALLQTVGRPRFVSRKFSGQ